MKFSENWTLEIEQYILRKDRWNTEDTAMRRVILESPYQGEIERNVLYARLCTRDCHMREESPFTGHLLYTQPEILYDEFPEERVLGIEATLTWGIVAEASVVYIDYGITGGMQAGIARAEEEGRPVELRNLPSRFMRSMSSDNPTKRALHGYTIRLEKFLHSFVRYQSLAQKEHPALIRAAIAAREKALTFKKAVGAAVLTSDGTIFQGGNIENKSRVLDDHAEKTAVMQARLAGYSGEDLVAVAIVGRSKNPGTDYKPGGCGFCRQYFWENAHPDLLIIEADEAEVVHFACPLKLLYPLPWPRTYEDTRIKKG